MKRLSHTTNAAIGAALLLIGLPSYAVVFSPSQAELLNVTDVTGDFMGGGSLFSATNDGDGVLYDIDFAPGTDLISRLVLENTAFTTDLTSFDSFDVLFTPQSFNLSVKSFIRTGESGFFESNNTPVTLNSQGRVSLDLTSVPDLNDVRGFGLQIFDPANGTSFATLAKVETAPQPLPTVEDQLFSFETGFENWGGSFQDDASHSIVSTHASDGTQSLKITRAHADMVDFKWGTEFYLNTDSVEGPGTGIVTPDPDSGRAAANATQQDLDDFAARFIGGSRVAFDVIVDPAEIDPSVTFLGVNMFLNDGTGDFWSGSQVFFDPTVAETHTVTYDYTALTGSGSGALPPPDNDFESFDALTDIIRMGISTNLDGPGSIFIDNIRIITDITAIIGDFDGSGSVGQADLNAVLLNWGGSTLPSGFEEAALSNGSFDGNMSQNELNDVLLNWGNTAEATGVAVPEPATAAVLGLGGLAMLRRRG